jgi:hypothetical protein
MIYVASSVSNPYAMLHARLVLPLLTHTTSVSGSSSGHLLVAAIAGCSSVESRITKITFLPRL